MAQRETRTRIGPSKVQVVGAVANRLLGTLRRALLSHKRECASFLQLPIPKGVHKLIKLR